MSPFLSTSTYRTLIVNRGWVHTFTQLSSIPLMPHRQLFHIRTFQSATILYLHFNRENIHAFIITQFVNIKPLFMIANWVDMKTCMFYFKVVMQKVSEMSVTFVFKRQFWMRAASPTFLAFLSLWVKEINICTSLTLKTPMLQRQLLQTIHIKGR